MEFLKSVQYKPKEPKGLKTALLLGEKKQMLPMLHCLVTDYERIKERAYLARFLVKINVPQDSGRVFYKKFSKALIFSSLILTPCGFVVTAFKRNHIDKKQLWYDISESFDLKVVIFFKVMKTVWI